MHADAARGAPVETNTNRLRGRRELIACQPSGAVRGARCASERPRGRGRQGPQPGATSSASAGFPRRASPCCFAQKPARPATWPHPGTKGGPRQGVGAHRRAAARAVAEGWIAAGGAPRASTWDAAARRTEGLDAVQEGKQRRRRRRRRRRAGGPAAFRASFAGAACALWMAVVGDRGFRQAGRTRAPVPRRRGHGDGGRGLGRGAVALRARPQIRRGAVSFRPRAPPRHARRRARAARPTASAAAWRQRRPWRASL